MERPFKLANRVALPIKAVMMVMFYYSADASFLGSGLVRGGDGGGDDEDDDGVAVVRRRRKKWRRKGR